MSGTEATVRAGWPALGLAAVLACAAGPPPPATLRVGTSGDYAPFSQAGDRAPAGFDVEVARAFARDVGLELEWVRFRWPELARDVAAARFDVAMSGVTVRPERSVAGRFGVPVASSGAVVLARPAHAAGGLEGLDRATVRIAVNAGGHLEHSARAAFPRASLRVLPENDAVRRALAQGDVDAIVTDTREAPHWQPSLPDAVLLGPFTRDRKAYLWATEASQAEAMDAWLLAREADGTLARLRARWLGAPGPPTATPLEALIAASAERLDLMPLVAEAKRAAGRPVRDRSREARVLETAWSDVQRQAEAARAPPPDRARVADFYRAQIEAAVAVQERVLAGPATPGPRFDLDRELRPALLRLGDRMAWALVRLDRVPERRALATALDAELERFGLRPSHREAWVEALLGWAQSRARARANSPAITGSSSDAP